MFRKLLLCCAALFAATACSSLFARPLVDIAIIDRDSGVWLPQYAHRGDRWVPGIPGHRYAVRLTNTSSQRVLVVLSVDGVNAVSGEDADPDQDGYVLEPWQSTEVAGWRKSMDDVAQFYFTDLPDSYAARTGRPANVGVVGVAVFGERQRYRVPLPVRPVRPIDGGWDDRAPAQEKSARSASAPMTSADGMQSEAQGAQRIGTGHGEREWSPVQQTQFTRASSRPQQVVTLRYDAPERLAAIGIVADPYAATRWTQPRDPQAFPGGFVPDP